MFMDLQRLAFCFPPYRLSGRVYGTLLNQVSAIEALGETPTQAPHQALPKAPILYIKPANTLAADGDRVVIPSDADELEVGAAVGLVIGRAACRVSEADALRYVAGYVLVNDVSVPHLPYYRPGIRFKARDGFCPIGPRVVPPDALDNPDNLIIQVRVDETLRQESDYRRTVRSARRLLADVTEFMTLSPGDVLTLGVAGNAPRVRAGQTVSIESAALGTLRTPFVGSAS